MTLNLWVRRAAVVLVVVAAACSSDDNGDGPLGDLPGASLLEYGTESPSYVAVADVRALAESVDPSSALTAAALSGIPALARPDDPLPWLDSDDITEFAHFGPTGFATEDAEEMITAVATEQDRADLIGRLTEAGWESVGDDTFVTDAPAREVASANWVHLGDEVVLWAPHERHLDVSLDDEVALSTDSLIVDALVKADGNRRVAVADGDAPLDCMGVLAAGDDGSGSGSLVVGVGDGADQSRVVVDDETYLDRRGTVIRVTDATLDDDMLVITTQVDEADLANPTFSTIGLIAGDVAANALPELYRC